MILIGSLVSSAEAKMLASLNHPNIATIHGREQSNSTSYLVMELVSGETLAERVKREGALPVEEALAICEQIAEALEAADEKGIIHRDLKPANVKLTPEGKVIVKFVARRVQWPVICRWPDGSQTKIPHSVDSQRI